MMLRCPTCHIPLCRLRHEGTWVHMCPDCRGTLVQDESFQVLRHHHEGEAADTTADSLSDRLTTVPCPRCGIAMAKVVAADEVSPFHVDFCRQCGMFWFDRGELDRAERHFVLPRELRPEKSLGPSARAALAEAEFRANVYAEDIRRDLAPLRLVANGFGVGFVAGNLFHAALRAARWGLDAFEGGRVVEQGRRSRWWIAVGGVGLFLVLALAALWIQGYFARLEQAITTWWEGLWW